MGVGPPADLPEQPPPHLEARRRAVPCVSVVCPCVRTRARGHIGVRACPHPLRGSVPSLACSLSRPEWKRPLGLPFRPSPPSQKVSLQVRARQNLGAPNSCQWGTSWWGGSGVLVLGSGWETAVPLPAPSLPWHPPPLLPGALPILCPGRAAPTSPAPPPVPSPVLASPAPGRGAGQSVSLLPHQPVAGMGQSWA